MKIASPLLRPRFRKGSFIALTMILAMALTIAAAAYIGMTTTAYKTTQANQNQHNLLPVAERGVDEAMHTLYRYIKANKTGDTWNGTADFGMWRQAGWTSTDETIWVKEYYQNITYMGRPYFGAPLTLETAGDLDATPRRFARLRVVVRDVPNKDKRELKPNVVAEVTYLGSDAGRLGSRFTPFADKIGTGSYTRQFAAWLSPRSVWANSLVGINSVTVAGGVFTADSYNALMGAYLKATAGDKATLATLNAKDDAITTGSIDVRGYVVTGGDNPIDGIAGSHVYGNSTDPTYAYRFAGIDPTRIAQDFNATLDPVANPSTATALPFPAAISVGSGAAKHNEYVLENGTYKLDAALKLSGDEKIVIKGNVTLIGSSAAADLSISGNASITLADTSAKLVVYTPADMDVTGNGVVNPALSTGTRQVTIFGTAPSGTTQLIKLAGNAAFSGVIYAPNATVEIKGGGSDGAFFGSIVGYDIKATGGTNFHYDESLTSMAEPSFKMDAWLELKGADKIDMAKYGL